MKVLVHLNNGKDKSYLLNFGKSATKQTISRILDKGKKDAVEALFGYAQIAGIEKIKIVPSEIKKIEFDAPWWLCAFVREKIKAPWR